MIAFVIVISWSLLHCMRGLMRVGRRVRRSRYVTLGVRISWQLGSKIRTRLLHDSVVRMLDYDTAAHGSAVGHHLYSRSGT